MQGIFQHCYSVEKRYDYDKPLRFILIKKITSFCEAFAANDVHVRNDDILGFLSWIFGIISEPMRDEQNFIDTLFVGTVPFYKQVPINIWMSLLGSEIFCENSISFHSRRF